MKLLKYLKQSNLKIVW